MSKGKFAAGTIFGAIIGLAAGILTAPKSGKETRAELKLKAEDMKNKATDAMEDAKDTATKKADEIKNKATDVVEDVKDNALDFKQRTEKAATGAKEGFFSKK
jgi:gas vesicle protein